MTQITDAKILILATNGFEQSELEYPRNELRRLGATVHLATPDGQDIKGWDDGNWGRSATATHHIDAVEPGDYDALVLPGGQINPDILRTIPRAVSLVKAFNARGKPIAAICHAPWMLVEAGLTRGLAMTAYPSIRTDLVNSGAKVSDEAVVEDRGIITSRNPDDLEAFTAKLVEAIEREDKLQNAA